MFEVSHSSIDSILHSGYALYYLWFKFQPETNAICYSTSNTHFFYSYPDLVNYLLYTTSFVTKEEVKNYKSLDSYKYFVAGWVRQINWKVYDDVVLIRGKVKHSYRVSQPPLQPWEIVQKNGTVVCGHCTCSSCQKHVLALVLCYTGLRLQCEFEMKVHALQRRMRGWCQPL